MAKKTGGLGRDFYSIFDDNILESKKGAAENIRISDIEPRRDQPRKTFEREALEVLADSIAAYGVLQPIIVRTNPFSEGTYEIIAGERRWRASKMAGLTEIPAVIFDGDELKQLSVDHVSVSAFGMKPPLSQNLGIPPTEMIIDPYLLELPYKDNDLYLICSDGLTDMVKNEEIAEILKNELPGDAIESLLSKALKAGGRDNITIILCKIKRESIWSLFGIGKGSGKGESK